MRLAIKEKHGRLKPSQRVAFSANGSAGNGPCPSLQKLEIVPLTTAFLTSSLESLMRRGLRPEGLLSKKVNSWFMLAGNNFSQRSRNGPISNLPATSISFSISRVLPSREKFQNIERSRGRDSSLNLIGNQKIGFNQWIIFRVFNDFLSSRREYPLTRVCWLPQKGFISRCYSTGSATVDWM